MRNSHLVICMDIFYVNGQAFMSTIDTAIRFRAAIPMDASTAEAHFNALKMIVRHYNKASFFVKIIRCDNEFQPLLENVETDLKADIDFGSPGSRRPCTRSRTQQRVHPRSRSSWIF